ncbi:MAG: hypothetical protein AAGM67_19335, partial [Bacteroidota bacterium]
MEDPAWILDHRFRREVKESFSRASSELKSNRLSAAHAEMYQILSLIVGRFLGLQTDQQTESGIHLAVASSEWAAVQKDEFTELLSLCRTYGYGGKENSGAKTLDRIKKLVDSLQQTQKRERKRAVVTIVLLFALTGGVAQTSFETAANLVREQRYAAAVQMYDSLYQSGVRTVDLFHNWGTSAYRNGDLGRAIWAYEKALRMGPGLDLTRNNLEVLRREVKGDILPRPDLPFERDWREFTGRVGAGGWSWLIIALSASLIVFLVYSWWNQRLDRIRPRVVIAGIAILVGLLWVRGVSDPFRPNGEGVILAESIVR